MTAEPEMAALPSGTVSFLFTDIEGSTRLVRRLRDAYEAVLLEHDRIVRTAIEDEHGTVLDTQGDSFFAVFASADAAVRAALAAQRALSTQVWPPGGTVRVRMGIHTAEAVPSHGRYTGLDVHRAARISSAAHGGQVLISAATRELVADVLGPEVALRALGTYRLKDLTEPERLFQLEVADLLSNFPPLHSLEARPHNLPTQLSEFVGRTREIPAVADLLERSRLVTLLGPGGIGKTRLAVATAAETLPRFADGVVFVDLSAVRDPEDVPSAIAHVVGLVDDSDRPVVEQLADHFRPLELLLVLDNFEQVVEAGRVLVDVLAEAPQLRILVTSRILLRVTGEQVLEVPPLGLPERTAPDALGAVESVELFVRRVRAVDPGFVLTPETGPDVAAIVRRLEGLPLAIELAAARTRLLPPRALAARLEDGLADLGSGASDRPSRHRTLRDAIAWSHDLLERVPRTLLRRLGIFAGGFTVEAVERVGAGGPVDDPLEPLADLLDASLIRRRIVQGETRFSLLEPIREFAVERLEEAGEAEAVRERHARHFCELAERAGPHLSGDDRVAWVDRLSAEHDNLRAALRFALETDRVDLGLRTGAAIWRFWHTTGQMREGRRWLEELLARPGAAAEPRAAALGAVAGLAYWQADYATAMARYEEVLPLHRELGDLRGEADTLLGISTTASWLGDLERGVRVAAAAREIYERLGARAEVRSVLMALGFATWMRGDLAGARPLWEESLQIARELGDHSEAATNELALASLTYQQGDPAGALRAAVAALDELRTLKDTAGTVMALDWIASFSAEREPLAATRLAAAAETLRARQGGGMRPESVGLEPARDVALRSTAVEEVERAWAAGTELDLGDAVALAHELAGSVRPSGT